MNDIQSFQGFHVGQRVEVIDQDISARVDAVMFDVNGFKIRIRYWYDNMRHTEWVAPDEIRVSRKATT
ncbi:hypothetical protein [Chromobacterium rhizoryzae]|uniref:DUF2158 domain-containing protein n=1 Tax=Chromobacterium rhizoryzae TaxID=1778675 RepID=A0AAD0W8I1_9NEIS|nr:hypothetical protein [Chromobacterium rhizoryzae]AXT46361.1 hypothetical protein D1345_09245 [Chromobacterium rhizoryzae]